VEKLGKGKDDKKKAARAAVKQKRRMLEVMERESAGAREAGADPLASR
jgi:hypothetical protein